MQTIYCDKIVDYWVPQYKWQVVDFLVKSRGYSASDLNHRSKSVVYSIYHKIRGRAL